MSIASVKPLEASTIATGLSKYGCPKRLHVDEDVKSGFARRSAFTIFQTVHKDRNYSAWLGASAVEDSTDSRDYLTT